jgi:hypothetical protein
VLKDCIARAGSLEGGLKYYVGAANLPHDGGYAGKVLAEQTHLKMVASGSPVPPTVRLVPLPLNTPVAVNDPATDSIPAAPAGDSAAAADAPVKRTADVPAPAPPQADAPRSHTAPAENPVPSGVPAVEKTEPLPAATTAQQA